MGKKYKAAFFILTVFAALFNWHCLKSNRVDVPDDVRETLELSGIHKPNLLLALEPWLTSGDTVKLKAMYRIIANMKANYTVSYHVEDSLGNRYDFNPVKFRNYRELKHRWDATEQRVGNLIYQPDTFLLDYEELDKDFLINNLNLAFKAKQKYPWAGQYSFDVFWKWVLPYRCANEVAEPFRKHFIDKYGMVVDTMKTENPLVVAKVLNDLINNEMDFKDTWLRSADIQPLDTLEKYGKGNFYDIAVYKVKALRSFGIAAALDYTPFLADTNFGCAWATAFDERGGECYLFPRTTVKHLTRTGRTAKTYRRTFETLKNSLRAIKDIKKSTPPFLGHWDYIDITNPLQSVDITIEADRETQFAYLSVFNDGDWHPVDWAPVDSMQLAHFHKVGKNVVYLPVRMEKHKLYRLGSPFIAKEGGQKRLLVPDKKHLVYVTIANTAPYIRILKGKKYTLYMWEGNWVKIAEFYGKGEPEHFRVPANGLYLVSDDNIDFEERIFVVDDFGNQLFY